MAIYLPIPGFKGKTFKLCVLTRWDFNFCVRSSPLRRQHQGMDTAAVRQVPEGSGEKGKTEKTGCTIICSAPATLAVKS